MDSKLKKEMKEIMRELLKEVIQEQSPAIKDKLGRKKRPVSYGARYLFYCNEDDLNELRKICREKLHISVSKALRDRVDEVLRDAGVTPKSEG